MKITPAALLVMLPLAAAQAQAPEGAWTEHAPERAPSAVPAPPPPAGWAPAPAAPGTWAPPAAAPRPEKQRDGWYIGFGLGTGGGRLTQGGSTDPLADYVGPDPAALSLFFNVGATLSPRLLLGLDVSGLRLASDAGGLDSAVQVNNYDVAVTFFPWERGLFVKAGVGLSAAIQEIGSQSARANGINVLGGIGYGFWLGRQFNLTLQLEGSRAWYRSGGIDSTQIWNGYLGFQWY